MAGSRSTYLKPGTRRTRVKEQRLTPFNPAKETEERRKKWKKATKRDLKKIADRCSSNTKWEIESIQYQLELNLTYEQEQEILKMVVERLTREQQEEQARLDQEFEDAVHAIIPECGSCGSDKIKARIESHYHQTGQTVIGGRTPGYTITDVYFLYCTGCGTVYYKDEVENLRQRVGNYDFVAKSKLATRDRFHC